MDIIPALKPRTVLFENTKFFPGRKKINRMDKPHVLSMDKLKICETQWSDKVSRAYTYSIENAEMTKRCLIFMRH